MGRFLFCGCGQRRKKSKSRTKTITTTTGSAMQSQKTRVVQTTHYETTESGGARIVTRTVETTSTGDQAKSMIGDFSRMKILSLPSDSTKSSDTRIATNNVPAALALKKTDANIKPVPAGQWAEDCLRCHNSYRSKHGVPPLKLSSQLCSYAQEWADHLAKKDAFQHRSEHKYGENIYTKWSSDPTHEISGADAVDSWYSEIKDHTFGREPTSLKSGHFTQVIWRSSKELGVAKSRSKTGRILVVANYDPPGNMIGQFKDCVPPPKA